MHFLYRAQGPVGLDISLFSLQMWWLIKFLTCGEYSYIFVVTIGVSEVHIALGME
jgi:hypothetical protein